MQKIIKRKELTPTQIIVLSFLLIVIFGGLLLTLPCFNKEPLKLIDGFFLAASGVSGAGLTPIVPADQFNFWGQLLLLIIIQIGGLGFMTFVTIFFVALKKKITLKERIIIGTSYGSNSLKGLVKLTKRVLKYTAIFEFAGAAIIAIKTIPVFGLGEGIWQAIFLSISAFCNAGFDVIGSESIKMFASDVLVNVTLMISILLGGIGFFVWNEIREKIEYKIKNRNSIRKMISSFSVNTKTILVMTVILVVGGTLGFLLLEYNNELTIGNMTFGDKLLVSMFQSVSSRNAGYSTVNIANAKAPTRIILIILMFIGGATGSTAGGIKIITTAVIFVTMFNVMCGKKRINLFKREISNDTIKQAFAITLFAVTLLTTAIIVMSIANPEISTFNLLFETVSGFSTCGFSVGITGTYSSLAKIVMIILMYIGRVSTVTMAMAIVEEKNRKTEIAVYPQEEIMIG